MPDRAEPRWLDAAGAAAHAPLDEALWRRPDVEARTGLSKSQIDRMEAEGQFPARRQISGSTVGWLASEVIAWMRSRPAIQPRGRRAA